MKFVNSSAYTRTWTSLTKDGRTLELQPGETVELDQDISDPWLVPVITKQNKKHVTEEKETSDA
jgi:hypothetical protein